MDFLKRKLVGERSTSLEGMNEENGLKMSGVLSTEGLLEESEFIY